MCILFEAVTSFTDVWIEISSLMLSGVSMIVTSFTDVWIEI